MKKQIVFDKGISKKNNQVNDSRISEQSSLNDLYTKLENVIGKKKIIKQNGKQLDKFTVSKLKREKKLSRSLQSTERDKSINKDNQMNKTKITSTVAISSNIKEDKSFSSMLNRMKSFQELKENKINQNTIKKHLNILKSCVFTPKINKKSRSICYEDDFFKRLNNFEEKKEIRNKKLTQEVNETMLKEVLIPNKKLEKCKIEKRINSFMKWNEDREEKINKKSMEEVKRSLMECTFHPKINKSPFKNTSKFINTFEIYDNLKEDMNKNKINNINIETNQSKIQGTVYSQQSNIHSDEILNNNNIRKIVLKKDIKITKKDEIIIEKLLMDKFKIIVQD